MENIISCIIQVVRQSDSESDSSSEEEWDIFKEKKKRVLHIRVQNYTDIIASYTDNVFKSHFRLERQTFEHILNIIQPDLMRTTTGQETISSRVQFMIALWKMATMDSYRSICDRFNVGKATALRAVRRVVRALFKIAPHFISWPSGDRAQTIMRKFEEISTFPRIIGAIDGTHIKIEAPKENPADYINRKGYHSIQLQVVCDHKALITHCYVGHPGSLHDQRVFRQSEIFTFLEDESKFPGDSHLVGDAAYELHRHLLVPFKDNGHLIAAQKTYNSSQSSARVVVERCFALLKGRLRSLLHCLPMFKIDVIPEYVIACCVIHNICILRKDELPIIVVPTEINNPEENHFINERQVRDMHGINKRNIIMLTLQNRVT